MLIALELAGFKSFADKTRFDFPDGITVIVGPNGSGKSNVVDAIKWVLGAQSAKSLRGKDMIDVIFKGAESAGRKPGNSAEATLVFDNSNKNLPLDAHEVAVTRRVFRSGEGEYLINGQACRLKDIKDLFRGTGVGADAYSLIEQGKVDRMLQASPKDRRIIFEEAAGISRFKVKKTEALRRLQRVDQNLVRLRDIVDEVHGRLNVLKNQAGKAQKYREMTQQLYELRLRLGWTDYCELEQKTNEAAELLSQLQSEFEQRQKELVECREQAQQAEMALHRVAEQCQQVEAVLQDKQQSIAVGRNQQQSLSQRIEETSQEQVRQQTRLVNLQRRVDALQDEVTNLLAQKNDAENITNTARQRAEKIAQKHAQLRDEHLSRSQSFEALRKEHLGLLHEATDKSEAVTKQRNSLNELLQLIQTVTGALQTTRESENAARKTAESAARRLKQIHIESQQANEQYLTARQQLEDYRNQLAGQQESSAGLLGRLEGANERLNILDQLQQHLDGVDAGARELLKIVQQEQHPAFGSIVGLVAELLEVNSDLAPLIDTALGHNAHALAIRDSQIIQMVCSGEIMVSGRLTLMRIDRLQNRRFGEKIQLDGVRGVIGRADRLIRCSSDAEPIFRHLLGTTWLVDKLETALELGHFRGAGLRFVTSACQLIDADGTLTLGELQTSAGLVSRRSEIQASKVEIEQYKQQYQQSQGEIERLQGRIAKLMPAVTEAETKSKELAKELAHQQAVAQNAISKLDDLEKQAVQWSSKLVEAESKRVLIEPDILKFTATIEQVHQRITTLEAELAEKEIQLRDRETDLAQIAEELTASRVEAARAEQKLESIQAAYEISSTAQAERIAAVEESRAEVARLSERKTDFELQILQHSTQLAQDYLLMESEEAKLELLAEQAAELRTNRQAASKRLEHTTRQADKVSQRTHNTEADLERSRESISTLLHRLLEDYQIDLAQLQQAGAIEDAEERASLQQEAAKLRQDITSVGEVNLAALNELDELQTRYDFLHGQYEDLQAAKESLQRIIHKINADSRKLFLETLEAIRQNFQKLYRKSFGGGNADIVLEDTEDVLDCGIDIIATPPGKTALSNSLLSGGEKALTAVALLLAIFQFRPSPFCVLDEVDAPFDEANIGRFVNVLTEFLDWTKFIIVTHSKKTMTSATTLYGVTMQESGISKQVAVKFENVKDNGEIILDEPSSQPRRRAA